MSEPAPVINVVCLAWLPGGKPAPEILTLEEAAEMLRFEHAAPKSKVEAVKRLVRSGKLRSIMIGKAMRIPLVSIKTYLEEVPVAVTESKPRRRRA